jgi:dUTP pyrophosphatase
LELKIKRLRENAVFPAYQTVGSAGADLAVCLDAPITIAAGETVILYLGYAAAIPDGYVGLVFARSGTASKRGLAPANKVGVVDSDYRGEWRIPLHNHGAEPQTVQHGERIAQLVVVPVAQAQFLETDELDETARGGGGLGSTGD